MGGSCRIPWPRTTRIVQLYPERDARQEQRPAGRLGYAQHGVVWAIFERGFWDSGEGQLMEMEMLDSRDSLPETFDEDGMWEDELDEIDKPFR